MIFVSGKILPAHLLAEHRATAESAHVQGSLLYNKQKMGPQTATLPGKSLLDFEPAHIFSLKTQTMIIQSCDK